MHKIVINGLNTQTLPRLSSAEGNALLKQIRAGNREAKDTFVFANVRLVLSIVQRFRNKGNSEDLFQVGMIGLMKAIDGFDPSFNVRFSTYAVPMIQGEIRRFVKESSGIKVSRNLRDIAYKALHAREQMENRSGQAPSMLEVAAEIDVPIRDVAMALDAVSDTVSLQESVYRDEDDCVSIMEQLSDTTQSEEKWADSIALDQAVRALPEREREVLHMRYFTGKTQTEISRAIGISQAQVSRLEKNAIERLRACL